MADTYSWLKRKVSWNGFLAKKIQSVVVVARRLCQRTRPAAAVKRKKKNLNNGINRSLSLDSRSSLFFHYCPAYYLRRKISMNRIDRKHTRIFRKHLKNTYLYT